MRVLGIDPGCTITGFGVVDVVDGRLCHVADGGIEPCASHPLPRRLRKIFDELTKLIAVHGPDAVAIESVFVAKNVRSSLLLGHARGTAMIAASTADIDVAEYTPSEIKKALTGTGGATKEQIQRMVKMMLGLSEIRPADASDALAVAICHCNCASFKMRIAAEVKAG